MLGRRVSSGALLIDLEHRGDVAILTLAHGKANAFDVELSEALAERIDECARDSSRALVVTARGSIFSAGVDLLRVVNDGADYVARFLPALGRALETAFSFPKPMVAAVNGHAIAGGCILACAADRRLMARGSGRIGVPELLVGVPFPPVPLEIMRFAAAPHLLQGMIYKGATFDADLAVQHGLVDRSVDAGALVDEAIATASALAALPAQAFELTKRQLRAPALERMRAGRGELDRSAHAVWSAPETLAAIRAYIDRTFKKPER